MNLLTQFQCLFYSFFYGFIMTGIYHVVNRFLYKVPIVLRYLFQVLVGIAFGVFYFYGLVLLNDGILRFYFFIMIFIGYLFYQKYYAYHFLVNLEQIIRIIKKIISPFLFFFRKISVIIKYKARKVRLRWRKEENQEQVNS